MNKTHGEKFEDLWSQDLTFGENDKPVAKAFFEAGLREANGIGEEPRIPEGYFKIGEKAECFTRGEWQEGQIVFIADHGSIHPEKGEKIMVRRIPAWKPKELEPVFATHGNSYIVGRVEKVIADVAHVHDTEGRTFTYNVRDLKPFDSSKIGRPWSEI